MAKIDLVYNVDKVDLILVMGTTLSVLPFSAFPNMVRKKCWRVFVSNDLSVLPPVRRKKNVEEGLSYRGGSTWISICGRKVSIKPTWIDKSKMRPGIILTKWRDQYLFEEDCDVFVRSICGS